MVRLVIVTAHPDLYTPRRLLEEAAGAGMEPRAWVPQPWLPAPRSPDIPGSEPPVLLARPGTFSLIPVLRDHRLLTTRGARAFQTRRALLNACDQWRTLRVAARAGLCIPCSAFLRTPRELSRAEQVPGPPWYVKARLGSKGSHVLLARDARELRDSVHFLWGQGLSAVVQEDCRPRGPVHRFLVLGGDAAAAARAWPAPGEYRSNWHRGGRFEAVPGSVEPGAQLAVAATRAAGLPCAGVDVIGDRAPALLEVNASPGLEGLERATGRNLARAMIQFLRSLEPSTPYAGA